MASGVICASVFGEWQSWQPAIMTSLSQKAFGLRIKDRFPDIGNARKVRYGGLRLKNEDDE